MIPLMLQKDYAPKGWLSGRCLRWHLLQGQCLCETGEPPVAALSLYKMEYVKRSTM
eukprot:COSAG06_NODE_8104_length_2272_cov_6.003221_4_plen_56_part_00